MFAIQVTGALTLALRPPRTVTRAATHPTHPTQQATAACRARRQRTQPCGVHGSSSSTCKSEQYHCCSTAASTASYTVVMARNCRFADGDAATAADGGSGGGSRANDCNASPSFVAGAAAATAAAGVLPTSTSAGLARRIGRKNTPHPGKRSTGLSGGAAGGGGVGGGGRWRLRTGAAAVTLLVVAASLGVITAANTPVRKLAANARAAASNADEMAALPSECISAG